MEWTYAWPLSSYYCAYIDPVKSLPHQTPAGTIENPKGLPFWVPLQRYLANIEDYLDVISQMDLVEYTVNDPSTGDPLISFMVEKGKSAIWDGNLGNGMIAFKYNLPLLMSYRKRDDGLLGLETLSRSIDTRLSISEDLKKPGVFPPNVPKTNTEDANFSNLGDNI